MAHDLKGYVYGDFHKARDLIMWMQKGMTAG